jgi:hypothetical protein
MRRIACGWNIDIGIRPGRAIISQIKRNTSRLVGQRMRASHCAEKWQLSWDDARVIHVQRVGMPERGFRGDASVVACGFAITFTRMRHENVGDAQSSS